MLVVYYSRSGNTEAMAREIARRLQADILRIETKPYGLDFKGWLQANSDAASEKKQVDIIPEVVNFHPYRLIFLRSTLVLGKDTKYVAVSDKDAIEAMTGMKFPEFLIDLMIDLNQCIREGFAEKITTTIKDVTGKDAISFEQFVRNNKGAWL